MINSARVYRDANIPRFSM